MTATKPARSANPASVSGAAQSAPEGLPEGGQVEGHRDPEPHERRGGGAPDSERRESGEPHGGAAGRTRTTEAERDAERPHEVAVVTAARRVMRERRMTPDLGEGRGEHLDVDLGHELRPRSVEHVS